MLYHCACPDEDGLLVFEMYIALAGVLVMGLRIRLLEYYLLMVLSEIGDALFYQVGYIVD